MRWVSRINVKDEEKNREKKECSSTLIITDTEAENLVYNGAFERGQETLFDWIQVGGTDDDGIRDISYIRNGKSYLLGGGRYEKYLEQIVMITNAPNNIAKDIIKHGDTLVLSAWAKAPNSDILSDRVKFELKAWLIYTDDTKEEISVEYDAECREWQYAALPIKANSSKELDYIVIHLDSSNNQSDVYFSDVRLVNAIEISQKYKKSV